MTYFQIAALLLAGPVALIMLGHFVLAVFKNRTDFHIIQAFILFVCIAAMLVAFLGVR